MKRFSWIISFAIVPAFLVLVSSPFAAQPAPHIFKAMGAPATPKVKAVWNRYHDTVALADILKQLQNAYPDLATLYSIGESYEGRPIWCLEVTNKKAGDPKRKPAMLIDGNIHGNEVQAGEVVAYTGWYLCELFGKNEQVDFLLNHYVFYLIPTTNPDGRDHWFHDVNTANSSRSGKKPLDNDKDGLMDEDAYDDLNNDGSITMMRIKDPNGRWKKHPDYPDTLMVRVKEDERGEYSYVGLEGIDNDGDGRINEDGPGGYDSNRNWGFDWQPWYIQYGALDFPFSLPNTHAVAQFVLAHPNIVSMECYHNSGGMIIREPGKEGGEMQPADDRLLQTIGNKGETIIPFYRSMILWRDLYPVWGGETGWFYSARGIYSFVNELWTPSNMFRNSNTDDTSRADFDKYLLLHDALVEWEEYDHPTYGKVEIGGWKKEFARVPPSFLLEEECHRNMAFTLYHASQMPRIDFADVSIEKLSGGLYKVWVEIKNDAMLPSRSAQDVRRKINSPDIVTITGPDVKILSSGYVTDKHFKKVSPVKIRPERLELDAVPGLDSRIVQFIISGSGNAKVSLDSVKAGRIEKEIQFN